MKNTMYNIFPKSIFLILAPLMLVACSGDNEGSFPQVADPPPFDYVDGEELRSGMHQLAFSILNLDRALDDDEGEFPVDQKEIVDELQRIKETAEELQAGDLRVAHPYLANDMDRFLNDVDQAIWQASLRSPRYYMAGRVSGSCVSCHQGYK